MCCEHGPALDLPPAVIEMLAHYRDLQRRHGWDWGDEHLPDLFRWSRFQLLGPVLERAGADGDWAGALRSVIGDDVPAGIVVIRANARAGTGPPRPLIAGHTVPIDVVTDDGIETVDVAEPPFHGAVRMCDTARLHLRSPRCARWSVTDDTGGAWFPGDAPPKWDVHGRGYFHAHDVTLDVPAVALTVTCTRGLEFDVVERAVTPAAGEMTVVEADPPRLIDPAADGWWGGDLHVHLNYSGDLVCAPEVAERMQRGEGLHLMSLLAGNLSTSRVYDRELLAATVGGDLWSGADGVARMGVEYRTDLFGHVHGLGPAAVPHRLYAGHERSDAPDDWPPNAAACAELRSLGATVGYPHPAYTDFPDASTDRFFATPRSVEARELIADAALGLVDSIDLISPFDDEGAVFLYHRLLSCGLRLAATAGTDVFLSFSRGPGTASNPPGWGRVYAHLGDAALTVPAFQDAIRAGRTVVTNGPWLTLTVDGAGPGTVLDRAPGDRLRAEVTCTGDATVSLVGPDGELATGPGVHHVAVDGPLWLAAVARGPGGGRVLDASAFAHTGAVHVEVGGRRVARERDARWCLDYLDRLEAFVAEHGRFSAHSQHADFVTVVTQARRYYAGVRATAVG
jgi:hypothetical protein